MSQPPAAHHEGVSCDGCMTPNFAGNRYKCLKCFDFDLCHTCFSESRFNMTADRTETMHTADHPMQCILSQRDFNVLYEGDQTKNYETCKIVVFTCPYCCRAGFNHKTFLEHLTRDHPEPPNPPCNVICPLCVACPNEFDANREVDNMKVHWTSVHSNFDPGTYRLSEARNAARRPMLARRTARQPAGNAQNPRRVAARTLSRLYAEVLQESANANTGNNGGGGGQAAAAQPVAFNLPPWTSDLTDVDEMFRLVNMNRNLPPLPTNFPTVADVARLGNAQAQFQPLNTTTTTTPAPFVPATRSNTGRATSGLYHQVLLPTASTINEYAAPSSSRGTANRTIAVPSVRVMKIACKTDVYKRTYDNEIDDPDLALSEDENSSESEDEEYESADDGDDKKSLSESEDDKEREDTDSDSEFEFLDDGILKNQPDDDVYDSELKVSDDYNADQYAAYFTSPIVDPANVPNPIQELRHHVADSEWAKLVRCARECSDEDTEYENRADTPIEDENGDIVWEESADPQCFVELQLDTSQLKFTNPTQYWTDKRFLRQKKLQRDLSMLSNMETCLEQADVAKAALRAGVGFDYEGREFDSISKSVKAALKNIRFGRPEVGEVSKIKEDVLMVASRRLESESEMIEQASPPSSSHINGVAPSEPPSKTPVAPNDSDGETSEEEEENNVDEEYGIAML